MVSQRAQNPSIGLTGVTPLQGERTDSMSYTKKWVLCEVQVPREEEEWGVGGLDGGVTPLQGERTNSMSYTKHTVGYDTRYLYRY